MVDALKMLEEWNRKSYYFTVGCGGNYQPGDGYYVRLKSPGRTVAVGEYDMTKEDPDDPDDLIFPDLSELIREAVRQWHADQRLKRWEVLFNEKGTFPDGLAVEVRWQTDTGHSCITMDARTEQDVKDRIAEAYTRAGRNPPEVYGMTERELLEK